MKLTRPRRLALTLTASIVTVVSIPASAYGKAKAPVTAHTLHLFQKLVTKHVVSGRGRTLSNHAKLASGDRVSTTYREFSGSHLHHGSGSVGSGTMTCYFTSRTNALCTAKISVSSSSIIATRVPVAFLGSTVDIAVNGGTGSYRNVHGLISATTVSRAGNQDLTIVVAPKLSSHA